MGTVIPDSDLIDRLRARLAAIDLDRLTPIEALALLAELKKEGRA